MVLFALLEQIKATDTVDNRSITLSCLSTHCVDLCYINQFDWCNRGQRKERSLRRNGRGLLPFLPTRFSERSANLNGFSTVRARKALSVRFSTNTLNDLRHFIGVDVTLSSAR